METGIDKHLCPLSHPEVWKHIFKTINDGSHELAASIMYRNNVNRMYILIPDRLFH